MVYLTALNRIEEANDSTEKGQIDLRGLYGL